MNVKTSSSSSSASHRHRLIVMPLESTKLAAILHYEKKTSNRARSLMAHRRAKPFAHPYDVR